MNLAKYDLNLLITLDALLQERNVTRAARRLGLSQPAVSSALARLREMFGDELMVRVGRGFELTSLGCELVEPVRHALREVEGVLATRDAFDPATEHRMFRVAARDFVTYLLLQPLVARLAESAPHIKVCFSLFDCESLELLERDEIDLVIMRPHYQATMVPARQRSPFPSQPLLIDRWVCAVWSEHPRVGDHMTVDDYLSLPHLIFLPGPGHRLRPRVPVSPVDQKRRVAATAESFVVMPLVLPGTELVCLTPEIIGRKLCEMADIRLVETPHELPELEQSMFWGQHRASDPGLAWFREQLRQVAVELQVGVRSAAYASAG